MEDTIITFEIAKLAKEKGFDGNCYAFYEKEFMRNDGKIIYTFGPQCNKNYLESEYKRHNNGKYLAPTQSLLAKWLREKCSLYVYPILQYPYYGYEIRKIQDDDKLLKEEIQIGDNFEEAYEIGLQEVLKLI